MSGSPPPPSSPPPSSPPDQPSSAKAGSAAAGPPPQQSLPQQPLPQRYEATIHSSERRLAGVDASTGVSDLDLDRVPDPDGGVRVLIDQTDIARLISEGYEVRLQQAIPVRPLDPSLIASDDDVNAWFTERVSGTRESGRESSSGEQTAGEEPTGDR